MKDAPEHGGSGVSIHAPTKGATLSFLASVDFFDSFNPRSHEGSDNESLAYQVRKKGFNPRSHEGSDSDRKA